MDNDNIREIVFDALMLIDDEGKKSHLVIREVLDKYDYLNSADKNFIKRVTEGTVQKRITLDWVLNKFADRPMHMCKPSVREVLRMGAYQILYMDRVPDSAACDEAVKVCVHKCRKEFSGFVNAVLRKVSTEKENVLDFDSIENEVKRLSVKYSLPENIVLMLTKEQDNAEALIDALAKERPTVVRILKPEREEELLRAWKEEGVRIEKSPHLEYVYRLGGVKGVASLPGFRGGMLYFQDESSMLCVRKALEDINDNPVIIDLCAAPGGKTMYAAELLNGKGTIRSFDVSEEKVSLLKQNAQRLGFKNVSCSVNNARKFNDEYKEIADLVIADVPCSGIGVMSRKSDLKYHITNEGMAELCKLQKEIILNAADYVRPGGVLCYSTCTIHQAENEKAVKYLLKNRPEFTLEYEKQLRPDVDDTDGFYIAKLRKNNV